MIIHVTCNRRDGQQPLLERKSLKLIQCYLRVRLAALITAVFRRNCSKAHGEHRWNIIDSIIFLSICIPPFGSYRAFPGFFKCIMSKCICQAKKTQIFQNRHKSEGIKERPLCVGAQNGPRISISGRKRYPHSTTKTEFVKRIGKNFAKTVTQTTFPYIFCDKTIICAAVHRTAEWSNYERQTLDLHVLHRRKTGRQAHVRAVRAYGREAFGGHEPLLYAAPGGICKAKLTDHGRRKVNF